MSRRLRLLLLIATGLVVTIAMVLAGLYFAAQYEPAFYQEAMAIDPDVLEKASDDMVRRSTALANAVRK